MKYRAEIDGLRAVAVIPVILFHAGFTYFRGGFVGVDVFFVISGYLITTIILLEREQGTFSLLHFYERRARRILPPLFLVMLVSLPCAWLWLMPDDMKDFAQSLVAVSVFSSNFLFWQEAGYWATPNDYKPLLHTWSLAVEEQYYILFPLFLLLMWRLRRRWLLPSFVVTAVASLLLAQWGAYYVPDATFYWLPMRAWELAIGGIIAFCALYRPEMMRTLQSNRLANEALGLVGLFMIGYAVFVFDERIPFPSFYALIPTLGAALIILFTSPQTQTGRLLGAKPLVGIGLISYSVYLWHQPLFAFARLRSVATPSALLLVGLVLCAFLLAYLSWRFVERPFRNREGISRKSVFTFALAGSLAFIVIGGVGNFAQGFGDRTNSLGQKMSTLEEKLGPNRGLGTQCEFRLHIPACMTSDEPEILVWGDSFAMHLVQGILASKPDAKLVQITRNVCGPIFDVAPIRRDAAFGWSKACLDFNEEVRAWLLQNNTVRYAVLSSPFLQYFEEYPGLLYRNDEIVPPSVDLMTQELEKTLAELVAMGITPVVFSPPPATGRSLGKCLASAQWQGLSLDRCNFQKAAISADRVVVYGFLDNIEADYHVVRLDELMCDSSLCITHLGLAYLYSDERHLAVEGSAALGKQADFYGMIVADAVARPLPMDFVTVAGDSPVHPQ